MSSAEIRSNELKDRGNSAFRTNDFGTADNFYTAAIQLNPTNVLLYTNRAQARLRMGRWRPAADDARTALSALFAGRDVDEEVVDEGDELAEPTIVGQHPADVVDELIAHSQSTVPSSSPPSVDTVNRTMTARQRLRLARPKPIDRPLVPSDKPAMKAHYLLAQAEIELQSYDLAYLHAVRAYKLCCGFISPSTNQADRPTVGPANPRSGSATSLRPMSALVIRTKLARWQARDRERLTHDSTILPLLKKLLVADAFSDANKITDALRAGLIDDAVKTDRMASNTSQLRNRLVSLADVFARADPTTMAAREIPAHLIDPISFNLMHDPVITPAGHTYERASILEHLSRQKTDPMTARPLTAANLVPNLALRDACDHFANTNRAWLCELD